MKTHRTAGRLEQIGSTLLCIMLSCLGLWASFRFQLPLWLDTLGVCLAAYYTGNLPMTLLTSMIPHLLLSDCMAYPPGLLIGNLLTALAIYCLVRWDYLKTLKTSMMSSFAVGLLSVIIFTPIVLHFNDGLTLNIWGDALIDMLHFYKVPDLICVLAGEAIVHVVDKQFCFLLAFLVIRLFRWLRQCPRNGHQAAVTAASLALVLSLLAPLTVPADAAPAEESSRASNSLSEYIPTIYNNTNGLPSTSVNIVGHTPDGSIWAGGYAGLCQYDGTEFTYVTENQIANVTALMTDRQGRLWIGTNDQGVAVLDKKQFRFINRSHNLSDNSVRTVYQAENGDIYVGTSAELCRISEDCETVTQLDHRLRGVWSIAENEDGLMACVDYNGALSLLQDDRLLNSWEPESREARYNCVLSAGSDFLTGTAGNQLYRISFRGGQMVSRESISIGDLQYINRIRWDSKGNLWVCAYNGVGFLNPQGQLVRLRYPDFEESVQDMIEDYEGNYWLTSSSNGLMKLSRSPFSDLHAYLGMQPASVNAVTDYRDTLYCGTDSGLSVIDNHGNVIQNAISQAVGTHRVRCVMVDSKDRLWVCTYGGGLLCWPGGDAPVQRYTQEEHGTAGNYFRCLLELPDGTMAAGGSEGLTFLKDGQVTGVLNETNGLDMTQILCLSMGQNGTLYAGSDGSGIYVIRDGQVVGILNEADGLSSRIILRIIPYRDGFFVVTSNSLNYVENGQGRVLKKFPYFNNFDMVLHGEEAWVLASCGIIVTDLEDLLRDDDQPLTYQLFNYKNGLQGSLTANSWIYVDQQSNLYLCSSIGVQRINMKRPLEMRKDYKMGFIRFLADGMPVASLDGGYRLGPDVDKIEIDAGVFNYDQLDLRLRFYVEGLETDPPVVRQSELSPISYRSIPHGSYTLRLQILDTENQISQEISCPVIKDARMWENTYYHIYLLVVMTWMVIFGTWVVLSLWQTSRRKRELEVMSRQLEEQVQAQTSQILAQSQKMMDMQQHTIEGMATLIESRDGSTGAHVRNTGVYAHMLAERMLLTGMYPDEIDEDFVDMMGRMAPLHDVGKIKVSDLILNKPGRFTEEEFAIMKGHAASGGEIISQILGEADPVTLKIAQDIATYHHERWDGRGYPEGRKGTEIPLCARIMAVADVFDALTAKRVYKEAMSIDETFAEMTKNKGTQFEPDIVDILVDLREDLQAYMDEHRKDID